MDFHIEEGKGATLTSHPRGLPTEEEMGVTRHHPTLRGKGVVLGRWRGVITVTPSSFPREEGKELTMHLPGLS